VRARKSLDEAMEIVKEQGLWEEQCACF